MQSSCVICALTCIVAVGFRVPEEAPAAVVQLMRECMHDQPELRPTAKLLVNRLQRLLDG